MDRLDETDELILAELAEHARATYAEIGQRVNLSAPAVKRRVDRMVAAGVIRRVKDGVRVLGEGELKAKLNLVVWSASSGAVKAIEAAGGSVTQQRIEAEAKAAARLEKRNAARGKAPEPKAPKGDANKISARAKRTAAKA